MTSTWVVIPTYNERDNVEKMVRFIFALAQNELSLLIVDDSSPDGTGDIVRRLQREYRNLHLLTRIKKEGLGRAYAAGFKLVIDRGGTHIVQMDCDFSHDPNDVPRLLKALQDCDLAVGSRYKNGISVVNWPLRRLILSTGANMYVRVVTGMPISDTTGGFKAWKVETLKTIGIESVHADGYGFQIETNYRTWKRGMKITEIPIIFTERREGQSKMSFHIMWESFWLVWRLRLFG